MNYFLFFYFLLLSQFANEKNREAYLAISVLTVLWIFADRIFIVLGANYASSVFVATCFSIGLAVILTNTSGRMAAIQSAIMITAASIHTIQISDTINATNYVYDNYEIYITIIALFQIAITSNDFFTSCYNSLKSLLTYLRRRNFNNVCYNQIANKIKSGEIET